MIDENYKKSCKEVIEILSCIPKEDYAKIPNEIIKVLENDKDENYNFEYDPRKTLDEQNVSKQAKTIIAIFFRDYWSTPEQRKKIKSFQSNKRNIIEEEKRQRFDSENLFKTKSVINEELERNKEKSSIIVYRKNIFSKILNKIKNLFKRNRD